MSGYLPAIQILIEAHRWSEVSAFFHEYKGVIGASGGRYCVYKDLEPTIPLRILFRRVLDKAYEMTLYSEEYQDPQKGDAFIAVVAQMEQFYNESENALQLCSYRERFGTQIDEFNFWSCRSVNIHMDILELKEIADRIRNPANYLFNGEGRPLTIVHIPPLRCNVM